MAEAKRGSESRQPATAVEANALIPNKSSLALNYIEFGVAFPRGLQIYHAVSELNGHPISE